MLVWRGGLSIYIYIYREREREREMVWAICLTAFQFTGLMSRVFAKGPEDRGSIQGRVIPKTQKMVLNAALLSTQHYNVRIKDKVEQSREWSSALSHGVVAIGKGAFGSSTT